MQCVGGNYQLWTSFPCLSSSLHSGWCIGSTQSTSLCIVHSLLPLTACWQILLRHMNAFCGTRDKMYWCFLFIFFFVNQAANLSVTAGGFKLIFFRTSGRKPRTPLCKDFGESWQLMSNNSWITERAKTPKERVKTCFRKHLFKSLHAFSFRTKLLASWWW